MSDKRLTGRYTMKKQYTKKQITEAIAYWEKQLKLGNYKRVDESYLDWNAVTLGDPDDPWDIIGANTTFGDETLKIRNRKTGQ